MRIAVAGGTGMVGRYVVEAAEGRGHQVVVASRRTGVDLVTGEGLDAALDGVEAVVDATNPSTLSRAGATEFFTTVAGRLQAAGHRSGLRHLVVLSIVGVDRVPGYGYYQAKLAHEAASLAGPVPASVVRATQFHEFAGQLLSVTRKGPVGMVPRMRVQSVAARSVGEALVDRAEGAPGPTTEVAGPAPGDLVAQARALLRRQGRRALVLPVRVPGAAGRAMRSGALLPSPGARLVGPAFADWLAGADSAAVLSWQR